MMAPMVMVATRPLLMIWGTMRCTVSTGMAKPMPANAPLGE
jgi:hypothetical protein